MKTAVVGEGQTQDIIHSPALIDVVRDYGFHPNACKASEPGQKARSSGLFGMFTRISLVAASTT